MACNGLTNRAKKGTCRICQRSRNTKDQVKAVGEVRHGFAMGHVWECIDIKNCDKVAAQKINDIAPGTMKHEKIKNALKQGRFTEYTYFG